jgi:hypothetical protein
MWTSRLAARACALGVVLMLGRIPSAAADVSLVGDTDNATRGSTTTRLVEPETPVKAPKTKTLTDDESKQKLFDDSNAKLADAEAKVDNLKQQLTDVNRQIAAGGSRELVAKRKELRSQLNAARDLVGTRRDAVNTAGNAILSKAYGGEYGTLARNWIDIKNSGPFVVGLVESTIPGMVGAGKAVVDFGKGLFTKSEPLAAPDPTTVRSDRIADRQKELQTELARIQDGASVNRLEGNWYGQNVVGPYLLADVGVGATMATAGRVSSALEKAAAPVAETASRIKIGEGTFSTVYREGDMVVKEIKPRVLGVGDVPVSLDAAGRAELATTTVNVTNEVADAIGHNIVPKMVDAGDGVIRQPFVDGMHITELKFGRDPQALLRANDQMTELTTKAARSLGMDSPYESLSSEAGWRLKIDTNAENFRFDQAGNVVRWFDPVSIFPK